MCDVHVIQISRDETWGLIMVEFTLKLRVEFSRIDVKICSTGTLRVFRKIVCNSTNVHKWYR